MSPASDGRTLERSVIATARWAGALNILSGVPDGFSVATMRRLVVRGDVAATAASILGSESLYRFAFVADLVGILMFVASAVLLYEIFKPASRRLALLFLILILGCALIQSLNCLQDIAALTLLERGPALSALPPAQANALAYLFLRLHSSSFQLALYFCGCSSIVMGFLIPRSTFVPRILGPLMMIDGLGYLVFSLASFLSPPAGARLFPYIPMATAAVGEGALFLWLIFKGVNAERWHEQAAATDRRAAA